MCTRRRTQAANRLSDHRCVFSPWITGRGRRWPEPLAGRTPVEPQHFSFSTAASGWVVISPTLSSPPPPKRTPRSPLEYEICWLGVAPGTIDLSLSERWSLPERSINGQLMTGFPICLGLESRCCGKPVSRPTGSVRHDTTPQARRSGGQNGRRVARVFRRKIRPRGMRLSSRFGLPTFPSSGRELLRYAQMPSSRRRRCVFGFAATASSLRTCAPSSFLL